MKTKKTYLIAWKELFRSLTKYMSIAIILPIVAFMVFRYVSLGLDHEKTFEHLSFPLFVLIILLTPVFSSLFSLMIALFLKRAKISLDDESIEGLNDWGIKNKIPLNDITKTTPFYNNGIRATVVHSRNNGKIYISDKTKAHDELMGIINLHLPTKKQT